MEKGICKTSAFQKVVIEKLCRRFNSIQYNVQYGGNFDGNFQLCWGIYSL